ncbi:MAG: tRNA (adenosine(37)-N6)-dimethylallyltransferase MiaA [Thermoanaerobaculia bacterium]
MVLAGPTGVGKSETGIRLGARVEGEIVNYDSVQLYRGFDIGSAKPDTATRLTVPHHLFDLVDADETFSAADYAHVARTVCADILSRGRRPILVGGTGFYLRALLSGLPEMPPRNEGVRSRLRKLQTRHRGAQRLHRWLSRVDPLSASRISPHDRHRVERALEVWITAGRPISSWTPPVAGAEVIPSLKFVLSLPRPLLVQRLDARVDAMYAAGLVEETRRLLERYPEDVRPFGTIGYREAVRHLRGEISIGEAVEETKRRTRAYAKRQMTWFRSEPGVRWIDVTDGVDRAVETILEFLTRRSP